MRNYDLEFLKRFSMVIGILAVVTVGLIIGAYFLSKTIPAEVSPVAAKQTQSRISPVGAVYAGATGAAAQAAAAAAATAAAAAQGAYGGTLDGKEIFNQLCTACHTAGVGGAPKLDAAGFGARASKGKDTLYKHAIEGYTGPDGGVMPPKGGNPGLSEAQIHATVDWMLEQSK
ncbi:c-type cytochrome [Pseudoxanthomonas sp. JBR18]|uniref:c-type cytochrome n=1 Tax=Pseudoxanthomonas sp. JBR18 TaxID=2969308 RepID=UPI0023069CE3|nr:c-type cytochrome [Pseudoxanthomonas sp. JBR18]WCE05482.1 c-type cytochrome [Pseudoxanthomonas sp. JBR18]